MGRATDSVPTSCYLPCTAIGMEHQNDKILKRLGLWQTGCSWYFKILQKLGLSQYHTLVYGAAGLQSAHSVCTPPHLLFSPVFSITKYFKLLFPTGVILSLLHFSVSSGQRSNDMWAHILLSQLCLIVSATFQTLIKTEPTTAACVYSATPFFLPAALSFWPIGISLGVITCMSLCMSLSPHTRVTSIKSC